MTRSACGTSAQGITTRVQGVVKAALGLRIAASEIPEDEPLFGEGVDADSIASLEIVFGLEREFGIQVSDEDLRAELFASVASLAAYVSTQLGAAGAGGASSQEPAQGPAQVVGKGRDAEPVGEVARGESTGA